MMLMMIDIGDYEVGDDFESDDGCDNTNDIDNIDDSDGIDHDDDYESEVMVLIMMMAMKIR